MDSKLKKLWVKALRSGKYRQGRSELITETGAMCCLGVLCHIQDPDNRQGWMGHAVNPQSLRAGLDREDEGVFVEANDSEKWTFEQIADYIEEML